MNEEEEKIIIEDDSGDKNYFTIIPNYIANHSTANDQALYFQMKRFAGEKGICFASEVLLRKKLRIGTKALKKSIQYLLDHKWIREKGFKEIQTKGGIQKIRIYAIIDIWKLNNEYYKGYAERTPLEAKGYAESNQRVCQKEAKGYAERTTKKNYSEEEPFKKEPIRSCEQSSRDMVSIFEIFQKINPTINYGNKTQRSAVTEMIKKMGFEKTRDSALYAVLVQGQPYSPTITTPYQLKEKLSSLIAYYTKEKNKQSVGKQRVAPAYQPK